MAEPLRRLDLGMLGYFVLKELSLPTLMDMGIIHDRHLKDQLCIPQIDTLRIRATVGKVIHAYVPVNKVI